MSWGKLLDKWHDEGRLFHLLKHDGSPACGVSYYTSTGTYPFAPDDSQKCKLCKGIEQKQSRARSLFR